MKLVKSEQAKLAVEVGRKNRVTFRALEGRGVLTEPVYHDEWWYVPIEQDTSVIPQEALRRVELLQNAGVPIKGMIVAHEAPLTLMAPKKDRQTQRDYTVVKAGLIGLLGAVVAMVVAALSVVVAIPLLVVTAVLIDPALIVVVEDGSWVEVCAWDESFG
jgi:hypothetical protein